MGYLQMFEVPPHILSHHLMTVTMMMDKCSLTMKREKRKLTVEKLGTHHLNQMVKVNVIRYMRIEIVCHLIGHN